MTQLLGTGIVNDTINRYMIPFSAKRSDWSLVKGDTIKVYGIFDLPSNISKNGQDLIVVHFKKNKSRKITHWVLKDDEFLQNITLNPSRYSKKLLAGKEKTSTFVEIY